MRTIVLGIAAIGALLSTAPVSAQFYDGPSVRVETAPSFEHRRIYRDDDRWERRATTGYGVYGRDRDRGCREVTIRRQRDDGSVVIRKIERCY